MTTRKPVDKNSQCKEPECFKYVYQNDWCFAHDFAARRGIPFTPILGKTNIPFARQVGLFPSVVDPDLDDGEAFMLGSDGEIIPLEGDE